MNTVEYNLNEIRKRYPHNPPIHTVWMLHRIEEYRKALGQIVNMLGPDTICGCSESCDGLRMEATEALRIAKEALSGSLES